MKKSIRFCILTLSILIAIFSTGKGQEAATEYQTIFDEICDIIQTNFYDSAFAAQQFPEIKSRYREQIIAAGNNVKFELTIENMLRELKTSHTAYYSPNDPAYYQLAAIFHFVPAVKSLFNDADICYPTVGIITEKIDGKPFIVSVLSGSPADSSGFLAGDEIVSVDGKPFTPVLSLKGKISQAVLFKIRRTPDGSPIDIRVKPVMINPKEEYLNAEKASVEVIEKSGFKIGYIHIWSYAGKEYHQAFLDAITTGKLKNTDALIWDLRYGWGGADPAYLDVFNPHVPRLKMISRDGEASDFDSHWRKPVVMLTNKTVRSGKEVLAYAFKKYRLGTVMGERTAGAVVAGKLFALSNKSILYLAVKDARVDGERLEGSGVLPDVLVPVDIRYRQGIDLQKKSALTYLKNILSNRNLGEK